MEPQVSEKFAEVLAALAAFEQSSWAEIVAYRDRYNEDLKVFWKPRFPRKKFDLSKVAGHPDFAAFHEPYKVEAEAMIDARNAEIGRFKTELRALAAVTDIPASPEMIRGYFVHGSKHHTQGYGAMKYARGDALDFAAKAEHYGVKAEVRPVGEPEHSCGCTYQDFETVVATNELGVEVLRYREEVPLKEWLAGCWKRGTNPRVYNPFLPHGLEEKLGVNFFGQIVA